MQVGNNYYKEITVTDGDDWKQPDDPDWATTCFMASSILLIMDEGIDVEWSYNNGHDVHGRINCEDRHIAMDGLMVCKIWFRVVDAGGGTADAKLRVWGWDKKP